MANWKKLGGRNRSAQHNTVRAQQATIDQLNVTKNLGQGGTTKIGSNLTIDGSYGYVNFGLIDGSNGYGFRNDDGSMQFRNPDISNWVDFTHAGHISAASLWEKGAGHDIYNKLQPGGRVGINTQNPKTVLDVSGSARIYDGSFGYLNFGPNVGGALGYGIRNSNGVMQFRDFSSVGSTSWQDFCGNVGGGTLWSSAGGGKIYHDSGFVGIMTAGTHPPRQSLDVSGTGFFSGDISCSNNIIVDGSFILGNDWNIRSESTGDLDISAINNGDCIKIKTREGESIQTNAHFVFTGAPNLSPPYWTLQGNGPNFLLYPNNTPNSQYLDISARTIIKGQQQGDFSENLLDLSFTVPASNYGGPGPNNPIIKKALNIKLDTHKTTSGPSPADSTILAYGIDINSQSGPDGFKI